MKKKKKTEVQLLEAKLNKLWNKRASEKWGNDDCEVCGSTFSCFHHFIRKSRSTLLRYDVANAIPLCVSCHYKIHYGEPIDEHNIYSQIEEERGEEWVKYINDRRYTSIKKNIIWLKEQEDKLNNL